MTQNGKAAGAKLSAPSTDLAALPAPVTAMREKIVAACDTGELAALRIPIDWNELRPLFAKPGAHPAGADPVEVLRGLAFDSRGFEILNVLRAVLAQPYVKIVRGPVTLYEWPAFAHVPTPPADPVEERRLWACVRFGDFARSMAEGRPRVMRLGIAADGVWHYFWSEG